MNYAKRLSLHLLILPCLLVHSSEDISDQLILPDGFKISIYAENIKSARQIAESKNGTIFVGSKSGDSVIALIDSNNDNYAETKITSRIWFIKSYRVLL